MQPETTKTDSTGALSFLDSQIGRLPISAAVVRFLIVGALAYFVTQAALLLLYDVLPVIPGKHDDIDFVLFTHPDARLLIASILAVECSIAFKFWAHETWTFRERPTNGSLLYRFARFELSCLGSAVVIVAVVNVLTPVFDLSPYVSNTIAAVAGVAANWVFSHYLIWPHAGSAAEAPTS
jgi:putative flippase GtrA